MADKLLTLGASDGSPPVPAIITGYFGGNRVGKHVLVTGTDVEDHVGRGLILLLGVERPGPEAEEPPVGDGEDGDDVDGQLTVDDAVAAVEVPKTAHAIRDWIGAASDDETRRARAQAALDAERDRPDGQRTTVVQVAERALADTPGGQ